MKGNRWRVAGLTLVLGVGLSSACAPDGGSSEVQAAGRWSPEEAATYLDQRESWWAGWSSSARDHETFCVSCHTALPYALSRPALSEKLASSSLAPEERLLLDNVARRVRLWDEVGPYYARQADASRGTEAVLNALILATRDARNGHMSEDTRLAFDNMWAEQKSTGDERGAWAWLNFDLQPWEAEDSPYYGAALAALAVGTAPDEYRSSSAIQPQLRSLEEYLDREYATQPLFNRTVLLLASAKFPRLVTPARKEAIVASMLREQRADGGWSLLDLNRSPRGSRLGSYVRSWLRPDGSLAERKSDGYATGLVTLALQLVGSAQHQEVQRGLAWLEENQNSAEGSWPAYSLNKKRKPTSDSGRFMDDAATSYAVLSLTQAQAGRGS